MAKESQLWKLIKPHFPKDAHVQRIETGGTGRGVPDVNFAHQGKEIWIELKSIKGNHLTLTEFQIVWMHKRRASGGRCFILAKKNKELRVFRIRDFQLTELLQGNVNWNTEPRLSLVPPYDWDTLFKFILHSY